MIDFLWFLLIGAAAGWLAGQIMKSGSGDLVTNIIVGVVGALVGGAIFRVLNIAAGGLLGQLVMATVGAVALIFLLRLLKK